MSDQENEDVLETPNELDALKARADLLGLSYHPSIGVEKLRAKVAAALADATDEEEEEEKPAPAAKEPEVAEPVEETLGQRRSRKKKEAQALVRIRVSCMNPNKKEWDGEIFTAGNSVVGTFKKYVPFNADEGWHVPHMIYQQLIQRQCQVFVTKRDARGNAVRQGKLIKEFAVEVLPALTEEELADLAQRQAIAKAID